MPNITKYMGRAIPGMSVIQGAWDAGQGVSSLIKGLQRLTAKQSGGPVPMDEIRRWMNKNHVSMQSQDSPYNDSRNMHHWSSMRGGEQEYLGGEIQDFYLRGDKRYVGAVEKPTVHDVGSFHRQNKKWDEDIRFLSQQLEALKNAKSREEDFYRPVSKAHQINLMDKLREYTKPKEKLDDEDEPRGKGKYKARDSIWMSVLDAMKKAEKKAEDRLGRELQGENIDRENYWEDLTDEERREVLEENWLNTGRGRRPRR
jgi:hypothetical protein